MPSDQFDFVMPRARATGCRPISPGLVHCRQLILKLIEVICENWSHLWELDCVSCSKIFLRAGNNLVVLKNSTEHAEPLFIALFK